MITIEQMMKQNVVDNIDKISLKLYKQFFCEILCNRKFIYTTATDEKIALNFKPEDFMHILGAQHILGRKYKSSKFNKSIDNNSVSFEMLKQRNSKQFTDDLDRFLSFSNVYYILTNCEVIYFDKNIFINNTTPKRKSDLDFKYILFQNLNNKKLHLGLDTYNKGYSYFVKSFLVTSEFNNKFIQNQVPVFIEKIEVFDKNTGECIFVVENNNQVAISLEDDE